MADYKNSVFLPETNFPLRAGLAQKEPEIQGFWDKISLRDQLFAANAGSEKFVLHDGPPYANGSLHIGHALNKVLKDVINRSKRMQGRHVHYVPGWDCHGLPIEWKVEQEFKALGRAKADIPVDELLGACRASALKWIDVQRDEFKRLGVDGDWDNPYLTMAKESEAVIVGEIHKFLMQNSIYRADRPVMWSIVEQTALAEAEIEYHDHKSPTVWVRFPITSSPVVEAVGASIVIWTTTPWTIPANQALAAGEAIEYGIYEVRAVAEGSLAKVGEKILLAGTLAGAVQEKAKITELALLTKVTGAGLAGTLAHHPLAAQGFDGDRPLFMGQFVTTEAGTGFVHMAPSHGEDDFYLCQEKGLKNINFIGGDGAYYPQVPLFAGKRVLTEDGKDGDANGSVIKALIEAGGLLAKGSLTHSYPHSWRSKAPIIYRCAPQWFIALDQPGEDGQTLRQKALKAIDDTRWLPAAGKNRIHSMVASRHDWCLSRQRVWGTPIAIFVDKRTGQPLKDDGVNRRVQEAFRRGGIEAWRAVPAQEFLGNNFKAEDYEQVMDIADVWFDSASTHAFTLEERPYLKWPADLYLEGSDQHRGWFHSSLLESVGTRGRAPYDAVLTHGFVLDEKGYKMSKSVGNVVAPQDVIKDFGADVLRLALMNADYSEDIRMGPNIMKQQAEFYRRLRNTLRYLLGALKGFASAERVAYAELPPLEKWVLHRLTEIDAEMKAGIENYNFLRVFRTIHDFCATDLSAFYFDIRKDSLYCDATGSPTRRSVRTVMEQLFLCLTAWLAPILCFTAEEAWQEWRQAGQAGPVSVHLRGFPELPVEWNNRAEKERWHNLRFYREMVTAALELKRAAGEIRSSLEAEAVLRIPESHNHAGAIDKVFDGIDKAEIFIVSAARTEVSDEGAPANALILKTPGHKCERCWKVLPEVGQSAHHPDLCRRCVEVTAG